MARMIGIDLGTTHSLGAAFVDDRPKLIPNYTGNYLTPSVVAAVDGGQILVGSSARELASLKPTQTAARFKRHMGKDHRISLGDKSFSPQELSSMVLSAIKRDAESFLGDKVTEAVITVPAYFNENQRQATVIAGELAGLKVRRIVNEPTAAALTYGFHEAEADKKILVFDLGGGTFDVTIMEIFEGSLEIIATAGESQLGGEDFTDALCRFACEQIRLNYDSLTRLQQAKLYRECESVKRQLSQQASVSLHIPDAKGEMDPPEAELKIDRQLFAKISDPLVQRLRKPLSRALRDAESAPQEIDEVILVGGATRMLLVLDLLREGFDKSPLHKYDPDLVVAMGAAIQAALLEEHQAVDEIVLTDVAPHTLGVESVKRFNQQLQDGYFSPIIHRNTTVPVSREESFYTVDDFQSSIMIRVYQGESRRVEKNLYLGQVEVKELPLEPAGVEVIVRFTYDLNSLLEVEVLVPKTGKIWKTTLSNNCSGLSQKDIERALRDMQLIKFFPRHESGNRDLLHFSENVIAELSGGTREFIEQAIDRYENEMIRADRDHFEAAKAYLLECLTKVGFRYEEHRGQHE